MTLPVRNPSKRFLRAAASERNHLIAHLGHLAAERDRLSAESERVKLRMLEIADQVQSLSQMIGDVELEVLALPSAESPVDIPDTGFSAARLLSGPAIRETAVAVLLRQPKYIEAIHYRDWYDLLLEAGYAIAGKNSQAVFLTQITRSPVVRKSTQAGIYELDRQAPLRLRQQFDRLQADLRDLANIPVGDGDAATNSARRRALMVAMGQTERSLEEALRVLDRSNLDEEQAATNTRHLDRLTA
jgi:hypothetical protein